MLEQFFPSISACCLQYYVLLAAAVIVFNDFLKCCFVTVAGDGVTIVGDGVGVIIIVDVVGDGSVVLDVGVLL